jgi:midasin
MYDPMAMNYRRQAAKLLATCPAAAAHAPALQNAPTYPELSSTLSRLLLLPSLTEPISKLFRPALIDICARLLHDANEMEAKFVALASLLQPHVELVW